MNAAGLWKRIAVYCVLMFVAWVFLLSGARYIDLNKYIFMFGLVEFLGTALIPIILGVVCGSSVFSRISRNRYGHAAWLVVIVVAVTITMKLYAWFVEPHLLWRFSFAYQEEESRKFAGGYVFTVIGLPGNPIRYPFAGFAAAVITTMELRFRRHSKSAERIFNCRETESYR